MVVIYPTEYGKIRWSFPLSRYQNLHKALPGYGRGIGESRECGFWGSGGPNNIGEVGI